MSPPSGDASAQGSPAGPSTRAGRERVPFRLVDADGAVTELSYSSPRPAAGHDEMEVLSRHPWFEPGQPLHNWMLHETDFYEEVGQIWGRRWGAEGIGTLREVLVFSPTENEVRPEYGEEWQFYYSSRAGHADLGRLRAQFDAYYALLEDNGVRVNRIEAPVRAIGPGDRRARSRPLARSGGDVGTTHADMFAMVPDHGVCVLAPHLVNYGFVRYLKARDFRIVEVPVDEYWDLAVNAVTLSSGQGDHERGLPDRGQGARGRRHRGPPGRLLREPQVRHRRPALRHPGAGAGSAGRLT
ncbi:MAG: hypothetical protein ACRD0L_04360, partial [Acidimicrobiales bacterium]